MLSSVTEIKSRKQSKLSKHKLSPHIRNIISTARSEKLGNCSLTWPQIFFSDLQMFVLGVSFVTTMGMVGMMTAPIMSSFIVSLLAGEMKSHVDMTVA